MSGSWDRESQRDLILDHLKRLGIYKPGLLFRGFDGKDLGVVKQFGTESTDMESVFCSTEDQLADPEGAEESALDYSFKHNESCIAVYDPDILTQGNKDLPYQYSVVKGESFRDALLAILVFK